MFVFRSIIAAASVFAISGAVHAAELRPLDGRSFALGPVTGIAYYSVEKDGYRVVATLASGEAERPVRFTAVLGPGQSVTVSAAGAENGASSSVEFLRQQDQVFVREATAMK